MSQLTRNHSVCGRRDLTCNQVEEQLDKFVEGRCTPAERTIIEAHLAQCQECYGAAESLSELKKILVGDDSPGDSLEIVSRAVGRAIEQHQIRLKRRHQRLQYAMAATFLIVCIVVLKVVPGRSVKPALEDEAIEIGAMMNMHVSGRTGLQISNPGLQGLTMVRGNAQDFSFDQHIDIE